MLLHGRPQIGKTGAFLHLWKLLWLAVNAPAVNHIQSQSPQAVTPEGLASFLEHIKVDEQYRCRLVHALNAYNVDECGLSALKGADIGRTEANFNRFSAGVAEAQVVLKQNSIEMVVLCSRLRDWFFPNAQ